LEIFYVVLVWFRVLLKEKMREGLIEPYEREDTNSFYLK
jgi:hypothetical protein